MLTFWNIIFTIKTWHIDLKFATYLRKLIPDDFIICHFWDMAKHQFILSGDRHALIQLSLYRISRQLSVIEISRYVPPSGSIRRNGPRDIISKQIAQPYWRVVWEKIWPLMGSTFPLKSNTDLSARKVAICATSGGTCSRFGVRRRKQLRSCVWKE